MDSQGQIQFQYQSESPESNQYNQHLNNNFYPTLKNYFDQPKKDLISTNHFQEPNLYFGQNEQYSSISPQRLYSKQGLFKAEQRKKSFIQISYKNRQKVIRNRIGAKSQTSLLNINFKTYLTSVLKEYLTFQQITSQQDKIIKKFFNSKANFSSFRALYGMKNLTQQEQKPHKNSTQIQQSNIKHIGKDLKDVKYIGNESDRLRKYILKKLSNGKFAKKIICGDIMTQQNKLVILKFIKEIRRSCIYPEQFNSWKSKQKN